MGKYFYKVDVLQEPFKDVEIQGEVLGDGKHCISLFSSYPLDTIVALCKRNPIVFSQTGRTGAATAGTSVTVMCFKQRAAGEKPKL